MFTETEAPDDLPGTLELQGGAMRIAVFYLLEPEGEEALGYLRVAFGQGNAVNRILTSQGASGQIVTEAGEPLPIRIASVDPSEAPGYLCSFTLSTLDAPGGSGQAA